MTLAASPGTQESGLLASQHFGPHLTFPKCPRPSTARNLKSSRVKGDFPRGLWKKDTGGDGNSGQGWQMVGGGGVSPAQGGAWGLLGL